MQIYTLEEYAKLKKKKNGLNNVTTLENKSKPQKLGNKEVISLEENAKRKNKEVDLSNDIAPVKTMTGDDKKMDFFTKGAFEDGYQFGDVTKTILGTAGELGVGLVKGGASLVEGLTDVARYGIAGISGNGEYTDKLKSKANANTTESLFEGADDYLNKYSVLGKTSESILQGVGQVGTLAGAVALAPVTVGTAGATALSTAILGLSGVGSGMSEAYQGGATDKEATVYGISKGVIDAVTESLFGMVGKVAKVSGLSKGITGLDDAFAMKLSSKISNQVAKNWAEFGVKSSAEGVEEFLSGLGGAVAKKLTYMDEKELGEIVKDEKLLEQFVVGTVTSGMIQSGYIPKTAEGSLKEANKTGRDLITGYTQNEQAVIDKEIERRVGDKNLSKKELGKIEEQVKKDIERGYIGIETIENALGGKTLEEYNNLKAESDEFNTLYTKEEGMSEQQRDRLAELKEKNLKTPYETALKDLQTRMSQEVREATKNDTFLVESYNEKARKSQKFEADITKYSEKERPIVQKIVDSGLVNNTSRTHDFVDFLVKVSADKGIPIEISNILKLKEARIEIADANGFVDNDKLVVNIDSSRAFDTIVGHELTHTLKTSGELYDALKETLFDIAKRKGEYDKRYSSLEKLYEGRFKGTPEEIKQKLEEELVADLVGDYIFSDTDFVRSLSVEKPNVFKKIYNEIKYLIKVATAGSTEYRKLEKAEKIFSEMYKENVNVEGGVKYSLSSMSNTFFGDADMTAEEFEKQDYKNTDGYKNYVEQCLNNYKQSRSDFNEEVARKEIEDSIEGIVKVALASKRAGYDIYDDGNKRDVKDSKNRLLFSSLEPNSDYFTSSDISTICDKRQNFADIYDDIVRAEESKGVPNEKRFFSNVDNYFYLHKVMADKGLTQPCRQCYVESMRKNLSPMANAFLRLVNEADANNLANDQLYQQKGKDKGNLKTSNATIRERVRELLSEYEGELTVETLTTEEGLAQLKIQAPLIYEAFNSFYGQSKPKMPKSATPFRFGELTALLTDDNGKINQRLVKRINDTGGFRLQSYSDFQIQNYTDVLQVIFEAGTIGLNGHAYTKVPAFLDATEGTNLKRNISIFMYKDGNEWKIDRNDSFPYSLEEIYEIVNSDESGNTSIIVVSQNEDNSAWIMANDNVGYGIPFHKSGLKMGVVRDTIVKEDGREIRGYKGAKDHTKQQTEVWKNSARKEDGSLDHKALTKVKKGINIYEFWDFNNEGNRTKNELIEKNVKRYIDECERLGYLPKFREYVMNNTKVLNNVLEYAKELGHVSQDATIDDISFNYKGYQIPYGYYKFLGDFGMFKPNGEASPQAPLSLSNYDFDKAVDFFSNSEELRRNEILQQFANGEERQRYRESGMSAEELLEVVKSKRTEVVNEIAPTTENKYSLGDGMSKVGNYFRDDIALETSEENTEIPANSEDIAPVVAKNTTANYEPAEEERIAGEDLSKKNADKIRTLKAEIQGSRVTKDITKKEFDEKIAKKQSEYDSLTRKDTKKAVDLRNQITNLETRRDALLKSLDDKIERANNRIESIERESRFDKRRTKMQQYRELFGRLIGDTSTWKDKKYGFQYQTNTLRRNLRDIVRDENGNPDIAKADAIYDELQGSVNRNEAEKNREANRVKNVFRGMKINNTESVYIQMLGELRHNPDTTLTQEIVDEYYNANKGKIDTQKVDKAIEEARKLYDDLYERVNEVLKEHGFKEIGYRKGYFPHFTDQKQSLLAKILNWKVNKDDIPTDIAGLTEFFEPQRTWQSFDKHRTSDVTDYNFLKGLDSYVDGSLDWIYHIGDIQKHRAFETELRYRHSSEQVQKKIDEYRNNPMLSVEEVEELIEGLTKEARNPLGNFVTDLNTRTNILAGKKSSKDRNMEATFNRHAYSVMTNINNRVTANQVVGSVSSALTNFIPITQSWGQVSPTSSLVGMKQAIQSAYRDDGMIAKSDFLTNRLAQNEALYKDFWDKAGNKVGGLMEIADNFTSQTVWRSKYYENIKNGMSEAQAIEDADQFAENVIGGRSKGNMPTIFHAKNPVTKMLTAFQLEVANQYGYMFKDMPQDMANESIAKLVKGYASMFIGAYVYNALYSSLTGRDSAFDVIGILQEFIGDLTDDEEENKVAKATVGLVNNTLEEIPFVGGLLGGGRVPISSALPYDGKIQDFFADVEAGDKKSMLDEATNLLYYGLAPMGGGQLRKTIQGASMFRDDLPVSGSYTKSGNLRFPVEETFLNVLQGHVFGQYANKNAREYFDRELAPLNKNQIQEYKELDIPISDYWDYLDGKRGLSTNEEKTEYIASLDLPISKQNILVNNVLDRKEKVDLTGYEDYSGYEEFNFAIKNPEKYAISKAVGGYKYYDSYMDEINSFKGDDKKEDIRDYIFSLDIDHGQKAILYRSKYGSKDDKNEFDSYIISYLNSRNDLSDEEKQKIFDGLK